MEMAKQNMRSKEATTISTQEVITSGRNKGVLNTIRRKLLPVGLSLGLAVGVGTPAPQNRTENSSTNATTTPKDIIPPADVELIPLAKGTPHTREIPLAQPPRAPEAGQQITEKIPEPKAELIPLARQGDDKTELIPLARPDPTDNHQQI